MDKLSKRINLAVNLAIVVVAVLIGVVFARNYLLSARSPNQSRDFRVAAGTKVTLPDVDWENNQRTLLLVLSTNCSYCTASASFYQQIAQNSKVQLVAVLPQVVAESKQYLSDLNVPIGEVKQSELPTLGVKGTPTLILVNSKGEVIRSWAGKLPPEEEKEVISSL